MRVQEEPRVLVTGAGGFVGPWLLRALGRRLGGCGSLVGAGHDLPDGLATERVVLDVTDRAQVNAVVGAARPTCVIHLAAVSAVAEANAGPEQAMKVNLLGTMNVAEAVLDHAPRARFVYVSTSEVYGDSFNRIEGPIDETALLEPVNVYAVSKAAADLYVGQMAHRGLDAVRLRPFNHTGPGQTETFAIPSFAAQIVRIERGEQEPVLRVGDISVRRDFMDVRDVVEAYVTAALDPDALPRGSVLNLASGTPRRIGDIVEELVVQARVPLKVEQDPARLRPTETPLAVGDAGAARRLLGWRPNIPFEQTISDVLAYWRDRA